MIKIRHLFLLAILVANLLIPTTVSAIDPSTITPELARQLTQQKKSIALDSPKIARQAVAKTAYTASSLEGLYQAKYAQSSLIKIPLLLPSSITKPPDPNTPPPLIKQFGYDIFAQKIDASGITDLTLPVDDNYTIGAGDELNIYLWGKIERNITVKVDRDGYISLPKVGKVAVAGLKFGQLETVIQKQLEKEFVNFEVAVSIAKVRTIKVFVMGDVQKPGAYYLPAHATAFHALHVANGPKKTGSLRRIKVIRNQRAYRKIDIYKYLLYGSNDQDPALQTNDTVFVPPIGNTVLIAGGVKRPGIYEIQKNSAIFDAMSLAGGLNAQTHYKHLNIYRTSQGHRHETLTYKFKSFQHYKSKLKKTKAQDMDIVQIKQAKIDLDQFVDIQGDVYYPGTYQFRHNMTINDLLTYSLGLKDTAYAKKAFLFSPTPDQQDTIRPVDLTKKKDRAIRLKNKARLVIFNYRETLGYLDQINITGAVITKGNFRLFKDMTLSEALFEAKPTFYANLNEVEIFRQGKNGNKTIINVDSTKEKFILQNNDKIFIKQRSDTFEKFITVSGEVQYPGTYPIKENETLADMIKRAGGLTKDAFSRGTIFKRKSIKESIDTYKEKIYLQEQKRVQLQQLTYLANNHSTPGLVPMSDQTLQLLKDTIDINKGRLIIDLEKAINYPSSKFNLTVISGDQITIPRNAISVQTIGGVKHPNAIIQNRKYKFKDYVRLSGGYSSYAQKKEAFVVKADGSIGTTKSKIEAGDLIYVPEKIEPKVSVLTFFEKAIDIIAKSVTTVAIISLL